MPTITKRNYNDRMIERFYSSKRFQASENGSRIIIDFTDSVNQIHKVSIVTNRNTKRKIAVAPLLPPNEIGRLHEFLTQQYADVNEFFYSSNVSDTLADDNINIDDIQVIRVKKDRNPQSVKIYYDQRSAYHTKIADDKIQDTYYALITATSRPIITRFPFGIRTDAAEDAHISGPITTVAGTGQNFSMNLESMLNTPEDCYYYLACLLSSDLSGFEHNNLYQRNISILFSPNNLSEVHGSVARNGAVLEQKGILSRPNWTGAVDRMPEIGRVFYDPRHHRRIALMRPGYDRLAITDRQMIETNADIIIKNEVTSNFFAHMREELKKLGHGIIDMERFFEVLFDESLSEMLPPNEGTTANHENYPSMFATAEGSVTSATAADGLTTPHASPNKAAASDARDTARPLVEATPLRGGPRVSHSSSWTGPGSARKDLQMRHGERLPEVIEKAKSFMLDLDERLETEDYYAALHGLLLLNKYHAGRPEDTINAEIKTEDSDDYLVTRHVRIETARTVTRTSDNSSIIIHKLCSFDQAKTDLASKLNSSTKHIYFIEEELKPLMILYFDGQSNIRLFLPEVNVKDQPWQDVRQTPSLNITIPPGIEYHKEVVDCAGNTSLEHKVFHRLHEQLKIDGAIPPGSEVIKSLDSVKSYVNVSMVNTPPTAALKSAATGQLALYSLHVRTIPDLKKESVVVAAYRDIANTCYEMGMTLVSRVQDDQYHDLAFIFKQRGSNRYFMIKHPTHPDILKQQDLRVRARAEVNRLATELRIPVEQLLEQLETIRFEDDPPKYPNVAVLTPAQQQSLSGAQANNGTSSAIKTIYDDESFSIPATRASLHFKHCIAEYLAKGYQITIPITGQHFVMINGEKQPFNYTQAVILKAPGSEERVVIAHPYHPDTVSKSTLERAINSSFAPGNTVPQPHYFEDDRELPRQSVTVSRKEGDAVVTITHQRKEEDNQRFREAVVKNVLSHMGIAEKQRPTNDIRPAYQFATRTPATVEKNGFWQKAQRHWRKYRKTYIGIGVVALSGAVTGVTFGAGIIPIAIVTAAIGWSAVGVGGTGLIATLAAAIKQRRAVTKSEGIAAEEERNYASTTLQTLQELARSNASITELPLSPPGGSDNHHGDGLLVTPPRSRAPAPAVGSGSTLSENDSPRQPLKPTALPLSDERRPVKIVSFLDDDNLDGVRPLDISIDGSGGYASPESNASPDNQTSNQTEAAEADDPKRETFEKTTLTFSTI